MRPRRRRLRIRHDDLDAVHHLRVVLLRQRILIPERSLPRHAGGTAAAVGGAVVRPGMRPAGNDDMDGFLHIRRKRGGSDEDEKHGQTAKFQAKPPQVQILVGIVRDVFHAEPRSSRRFSPPPRDYVCLKSVQRMNTTTMMAIHTRTTRIGRGEGLALDGAAAASRLKPCHDSSSAKNSRGRMRMVPADW